jgi:hypothetical protein
MSFRATDQALPLQAGTEPLAWTTMRANTEETIVISAQTLGAPTTTLELSPYNQAKLEKIRRSRDDDGTYAAPEGMMYCLDEIGRMSATEWLTWRNSQREATASASNQKVKLLPLETQPFNYARIKEDEAPQLHALSFKGHQGDNAKDGSAQTRDHLDDVSSRLP